MQEEYQPITEDEYPALRMQSRIPMTGLLMAMTVCGAIVGYRPYTSPDHDLELFRVTFLFFVTGFVGGAALGGGPVKLELTHANYKRAFRLAVVSALIGASVGLLSFSATRIGYSLLRTLSLAYLFGIIGYVMVPYFCSDRDWNKRLRTAFTGSLILSCVFALSILAVSLMLLIADVFGGWKGGFLFALLAGVFCFFVPGTVMCWGLTQISREILRCRSIRPRPGQPMAK